MNAEQPSVLTATATAAKSMQSIVQERYGSSPERVLRLASVPLPAIGRGEVLVRVRAASVDRGTWHLMAGLPYPVRAAGFGLRRPKYANPGRALAGTVEAVGADVAGLAPGDEVYGVGAATFAEYARSRADKLTAKPANLTFAEAATVPISGLTALQAVRDHGQVREGRRVLVIGASGGVGSFAVQVAKAFGAEVTAVCGAGAAKAALVRSLGADEVVDHTAVDPTDGRVRYDVILDTGGNRPLSRLRRALTATGRLVIVGGETDGRWLGGTDRQIRAQLLSPFVGQRLGSFVASENAADLTVLRELVEAGRILPAVDRTFPLAETPAAIRHLLDGRTCGKVAVTV
ncbi:NAD(P)-dependent alcohol dehydrogenase [Streptacidiphilus anmyonensis]|uniref:NAD(P)-dependent alcohol dehydrogenase n=1 Tax=Streptacidiphilus anmyonensis TaxID=405782 RepID=UPI001F2C7169|nr:NAD(P)-dependent alcohol dehydrogenase [Streptacidiphilus anmyonensis]